MCPHLPTPPPHLGNERLRPGAEIICVQGYDHHVQWWCQAESGV